MNDYADAKGPVLAEIPARAVAERPSRRRGRAEFGQAALEEPALRVVVDELQRAQVGDAGLGRPVETAQELAARRVQVAVAAEVDAVGDLEPRLGPLGLGHGDGPAELDDG